MTDLCKQCTTEYYGTDTPSNLADMVTKQQFQDGLVAKAECEGCGETYVDNQGNCVSKSCYKKHGDY